MVTFRCLIVERGPVLKSIFLLLLGDTLLRIDTQSKLAKPSRVTSFGVIPSAQQAKNGMHVVLLCLTVHVITTLSVEDVN